MARDQVSEEYQALLTRRDTLYKWYIEKSNNGYHKELSFEFLKMAIAQVETELQDYIINNVKQ